MADERRPMPPGEPGDEPDEAMAPARIASSATWTPCSPAGARRPTTSPIATRRRWRAWRRSCRRPPIRTRARPIRPSWTSCGCACARPTRASPPSRSRCRCDRPAQRPAGSRITRRQLLQAGVIGAAGVAAGAAGIVLLRPELRPTGSLSGTTAAAWSARRRRVGRGRRRSATCRSGRRCASARRPSTATWSTTAARSARSARSAPTWAARCSSGRTGATCAARATAPAST